MRPPGAGSDSIRRNAILSLANQLTSAVFTAALTLYLVRALGPQGYGLFALAISVGTLAALLADFGVSNSASRFVAEQRDDPVAQYTVVARALRLKLSIVAAVSAALFALAAPISDAYGVAALEWPLRGAAIALGGQTLMLFITGIFGALGRVSANFRVILSEAALEATASIALVALGGGAAGATFGRAIGYVVGGLLAVATLSRVLGRNVLAPGSAGGEETRRIASYAVPLFVTNGVYTLFTQVDVLLLGALLGSTAVGTFQAVIRVNSMFAYAGLALSAGVAPKIAAGRGRNVAAFQSAVRMLIIGQAALLAPLIVWAHPIVSLLLGPEFEESVPVLRLLALYVFLIGLGPLLSSSVNYLGGAARRVPIAIAALTVNAGIDVLLIPRIGVIGAAIGTNVGFLIYVPAHFWICRSTLGLALRPVAITLGRTALAVAAMALVLLLAGTGDLSLAAWALGGIGAVLTYVGILLLTGEVKRSEVAAAAFWLRRLLGRIKRTSPAR